MEASLENPDELKSWQKQYLIFLKSICKLKQAHFTIRQMLCIYQLTLAIFIQTVDNPSTLGEVAATSRHQPRIRLEKKWFAFKITEIQYAPLHLGSFSIVKTRLLILCLPLQSFNGFSLFLCQNLLTLFFTLSGFLELSLVHNVKFTGYSDFAAMVVMSML